MEERIRAKAHLILLCAMLLIYIALVWDRLSQDFWTDEIYTLKHFVLVPFSTTITDYHVPNNHILFSLIVNLYASIIGVATLKDVFVDSSILRFVPLSFSLMSVITTYMIGRLISNKYTGLISSAILIFTITFYEFGLQLRGYSLSILLVSLLVYYSFLALIKESKISYVLVVVGISLLSYVIPLNYLFVLAMFFAVLGRSALSLLINGKSSTSICPPVFLTLAICIGVVFSLLLYYPVLGQIFNNQYVESGDINFTRSIKIFYVVVNSFISKNNLVTVLTFIGVGMCLIKRRYIKNNINLIYLLMLFTFPFLISGVGGFDSPPRAFTNLLPVYSVIVGTLIYEICEKTKFRYLIVLLLCTYSVISFHYERNRLVHLVLSDLQKTRGPSRAQELNYAYYSYGYKPLEEIYNFQSKRIKDIPLVIGDAEPNGLSEYLSAMGLEYVMTGLSIPDVDGRPWEGPTLQDLVKKYSDGFYFVTRYKNRLYRNIADNKLRLEILPLSGQVSYHNFVYIKAIP